MKNKKYALPLIILTLIFPFSLEAYGQPLLLERSKPTLTSSC